MIDFAVWHEPMAEGAGRWVLAVDPRESMVLLCDEADNSFYWVNLAECKLVRAHTPDMPSLVMAVEPAGQQSQQAGLVMPEFNRTMRRNGGF